MKATRWLVALLLVAFSALAGPFDDQHVTVLVFTKTAGFRHDSIADGIAAIQALGRENGFAVEATEDAGRFTDEGLAPYRAVIFLNTTGDVLATDQERAFERYIRGGGGFVGIHSAADTEYGWAWYGDLVGAYFASHPAIQQAQVQVADRVHPATDHLSARWQRRDEWYNYRRNPRGQVHILATLDEGSYNGGNHGFDHPIAWCHDYDGGRSWYTGGGHTRASYGEPQFMQHILGGIEYASGVTAADCGAPRNLSPNNTGLQSLPPAQAAWVWYPYGTSSSFPEIIADGGRTALAGPVYYYDAAAGSKKLPAYYNGTLFMYEWASNWIKEVKLDEDGNILKINPFLDGMEFIRPISMQFGPDGSLYVLEWGSGFWGDNDDARVVRIDYVRGTRAPVARIEAAPTNGAAPLEVHFSGHNSFDPDPGSVLGFAWDFTGDGEIDATGPEVVFTYQVSGDYIAQLTVSDAEGNQGVAQVPISVGNTVPQVEIVQPPDGGFFSWGEIVDFEIQVFDPEDGTADCARVVLQAFIGHDEHSHPLEEYGACSGSFQTEAGHGGDGDDLFYTIEARYTDRGMESVAPLTARAGHILQPKRKQAEHYTRQSGVRLEVTGDEAGGGQNIGFIAHGDWISFAPMNLQGIESLNYRVASAGIGGRIEVRVDSLRGPPISTVRVGSTGDWQVYTDLAAPLANPGGTHELFFIFRRNPGDDGLFNINWIDFEGPGVSRPTGTAKAAKSRIEPLLGPAVLYPPYPNPFNPMAQIRFVLPGRMAVRLEIFDLLGQRLDVVVDEVLDAGSHAVRFDGADLASGVYIVRLATPSGVLVRRMVLLR